MEQVGKPKHAYLPCFFGTERPKSPILCAMPTFLSKNVQRTLPWPPDEVNRRIQQFVEEPKKWRGGLFSTPDYRRYEGELTDNTFELCRIIRGRTIVMPVVQGTIRPEGEGSVVAATVRLRRRTVVILSVVAFVLLLGSVLIALGLLEGTEDKQLPYLAGPLFLVALYLLLRTQVQNETTAFAATLDRLDERVS